MEHHYNYDWWQSKSAVVELKKRKQSSVNEPSPRVSSSVVPNKPVWVVSWNIIKAGPRVHNGAFKLHLLRASFNSCEKCLMYASDASPRKVYMSVCNLSALVRKIITSETAKTFKSNLIRWLVLLEVPRRPSVSRTIVLLNGSYAAHIPTVHESCDADVLKISFPLKNVLFSVCDFPSPVFPNIETTLLAWPLDCNLFSKSCVSLI